MSTQPQTEEYLAARRESCRLLGLNADDLTPHETIRADLATVLRLWLDGSQSALLAGGNADPVKLLSVVEALTKLVPETEHKSRGEDPRAHMWRTYLEMRRRGELADAYRSPQQRLEAARAKVAEIEAELAAITPSEADITPPGEIGECYAGMRPGPDDPPLQSSQVIEGKVNPAPTADLVDIRNGFNDTVEPWRSHMNRNFDPWADNR